VHKTLQEKRSTVRLEQIMKHSKLPSVCLSRV